MSMRGRDTRGGHLIRLILTGIGIFFLVVLIFSLLFMWPFKKVPNGYVGLRYGGGFIEGQRFEGERIGPTGTFFNGWADHLYLYPATQRNYIISLNANEGERGTGDSIEALNSDGVVVTYQIAVYFKLNLDKLQEFHENIGIKYHAWCDGDATNCSEGWERMLNDSFRQQLENALQTTTRQYDTQSFLQAETLRTIQTTVAASLKENVNGVLGDDYFCGPSFVPGTNTCPDFELVLKKPSLPDGVVAQLQKVQESNIAIQTKQNEVQQAKLEADAIKERQAALESCGEVCVIYEAIKAGDIKFWVLPSNGTGLNIQGPNP